MGRLQLLVAAVMALVACSSAHYNRAAEGQPCRPYGGRRTCGNRTVLSVETTPLTEGFGPNVCQTVTVTEVQVSSYSFQRRCSSCGLQCVRSAVCDGPMVNTSTTKTECCDGFTTSANDTGSTHSFFAYFFGRHSNSIFRDEGCTVMLRDTVLDCLSELGLVSFEEQVLLEPELEATLADSTSEDGFTLFVPSDDAFDSLSEFERSFLFNDMSRRNVLESHIREGSLRSKTLCNGQFFQPLTESVLLHIGQVGSRDSKRLFVNGAEIERPDACQARNGIVHVVNSIIPVSPLSIAEIISLNDERFGIFRILLNESNILPLLNRTKSRTVFLPTNEAFQELPAGAIECLLREENARALNKFVLVHISYPALYTNVLIEQSHIPTLTFCYLVVQNINGEVRVTREEIPLEEADVTARNGVIHVINEVINPIDFESLCPDLVNPTPPVTTEPMATDVVVATEVTNIPDVGVTDTGESVGTLAPTGTNAPEAVG